MIIEERRRLGASNVMMPRFGMGTAPIAGVYPETSYNQSVGAIRAALASGVRYLDTAPMYGLGKAEHIVGDVLRRDPPQHLVLSTKVGRLMRGGTRAPYETPPKNPFDAGWHDPLPFDECFDYSYEGVLRSFEDSQQRLGLRFVDMLSIHDIGRLTHGASNERHWRDLTTGGFQALKELRAQGFIKAIGIGVNEIDVALESLAELDLDYILLAGRYTLLEQDALDEFFPECVKRCVGVIAAGPFNSGILATSQRGAEKYNYVDAPAEIIARRDALAAVCAAHDVELPQAALQFAFGHPAVTCVLAGFRSAKEVKRAVAHICSPVPTALWVELKDRGLIRPDSPTP